MFEDRAALRVGRRGRADAGGADAGARDGAAVSCALPIGASADAAPLACTCAAPIAAAPVWGDGRYALDSGVCAAARHAGVVAEAGGAVRVRVAPGCTRYLGARRGGVTSRAGEGTEASFYFEPTAEADADPTVPPCPDPALAPPAAPR
ncbi:MAG: LCCL domain-containing protein [Kofleriaceae bacterium]